MTMPPAPSAGGMVNDPQMTQISADVLDNIIVIASLRSQ
jgi:hypothetical protein